MLMITCVTPAYAVQVIVPDVLTTKVSATNETITPFAGNIICRHRYYNGVYQYRRWNATRGYWVDPDWIDVT